MRGTAYRNSGHGLFQYPAMMLPEVQGALLDELIAVDPRIDLVCDPYIGSGTVLLEALKRNLSVWGNDINPLALLLCSVKAHPYDMAGLQDVVRQVVGQALKDRKTTVLVDVGRVGRWFEPEVLVALSRIVRGIRMVECLATRRFLWVSLAETIRLTSNSRTSTVKLHRMTDVAIAARDTNTIAKFKQTSQASIEQLQQRDRNRPTPPDNSSSTPVVKFWLGDTRSWHPPAPVADVIMTSPPYGDNRTTVSYGQHSWLPLMWIDAHDFPGRPPLPQGPYETDRLSLGGQLKGAAERAGDIREKSVTFGECFDTLSPVTDARSRFSAFFADLDASLSSVTAALRPGGWMFWTLGERRINGVPVPMTQVVCELLQQHDLREVTRLNRDIPLGRKRMAVRNDISPTMLTETILVMRRGRTRTHAISSS
jgi:hypothetical protein